MTTGSDPEENFFQVEEIHKCPLDGQVTDGHNNQVPGNGNEFSQPLEKAIGCIFPVDKPS
jgi:hypothetical protein